MGSMRAIGVAALIALSVGRARAQDNPACAKFEEPLAYNQCLAGLGPKAHATHAVAEPAGRVHTTLQVGRARNGRMFAEFTVGPARKKKRPPNEE